MSETTLMRFKKVKKEEKSCDVIQVDIVVLFSTRKKTPSFSKNRISPMAWLFVYTLSYIYLDVI